MKITVDLSKPLRTQRIILGAAGDLHLTQQFYGGMLDQDIIESPSDFRPMAGTFQILSGGASIELNHDASPEEVNDCARTVMELGEGMRKIEKAFEL